MEPTSRDARYDPVTQPHQMSSSSSRCGMGPNFSDPSPLPAWVSQSRSIKGRKFVSSFALVLAVSLLLLSMVVRYDARISFSPRRTGGYVDYHSNDVSSAAWMDPWTSLNFHHPTTLARENLRSDRYYVAGFGQAGYTNQFISYVHLIYLGLQTSRIPIIAPFVPAAHISEDAGSLAFGSVYNLSLLRSTLRAPILEWSDVKHIYIGKGTAPNTTENDPALEQLGCWSTRELGSDEPTPVANDENALKLELSFTRVPKLAYLDPDNPYESHTKFSGLAAMIMPKHPHDDAAWPEWLPLLKASRFGKELKPEQHLSCFDSLFYMTSGVAKWEWEQSWGPMWAQVGQYLRYSDGMVGLAEGFLRSTLGLREDEGLPQIITVHIRRGDFGNWCADKGVSQAQCFQSLDTYKDAVEEVRSEVLGKHGVDIKTVVVASNEKDPEFWRILRETYSWTYMNYTALHVVEDYTEWYPVVLDKVILSMGLGFVGTKVSTLSVMNAKRVEDWNGGEVRMVNPW